ncbi:MAG TPA: CBS domain-containing protein [Acidimicrobiales bacterium]|nr:CBS domain-containing protein [Acidimicrobiales bacterium]
MTSARDIMTSGIEYLKTTDTATDAAKRLAVADIGAVPVCQPDGRLVGMVTDRDIVTKVVAAGKDPAGVSLDQLADQGEIVTIGADDSVEETLDVMKRYKVRRLPVIDGAEVVGIVSQADVARQLPERQVGDYLAAISS